MFPSEREKGEDFFFVPLPHFFIFLPLTSLRSRKKGKRKEGDNHIFYRSARGIALSLSLSPRVCSSCPYSRSRPARAPPLRRPRRATSLSLRLLPTIQCERARRGRGRGGNKSQPQRHVRGNPSLHWADRRRRRRSPSQRSRDTARAARPPAPAGARACSRR